MFLGNVCLLCHTSDGWQGFTGEISHVATTANVQPGDLLYFSKDGSTAYHATIIVKAEGGRIYYAAHSSPQKEQNLADVISDNTVFIVIIKDDA